MPNPVVHFEIGCRDRAKTAQFFTQLFGWQIPGRPGRNHRHQQQARHYLQSWLGQDPRNCRTSRMFANYRPAEGPRCQLMKEADEITTGPPALSPSIPTETRFSSISTF